MKKYLLSLVFCISLLPLLQAQSSSTMAMAGTSWKGVFNIPQPLDCRLKFSKDTVTLIMKDDGSMLETMTYSQHSDTLTIRKVSGGSPCGDEPGVYKIQIVGDKARLLTISDPCAARTDAFTEGMTKE